MKSLTNTNLIPTQREAVPTTPTRRRPAPEPARRQYERVIQADIRARFEGMDAASQAATAALVTQLRIRTTDPTAGVYSSAEAGACPLGWVTIFERTLRRLIGLGWNRELVQVRQKGCELRIELREDSVPMRTIVERAEMKSRKRCAVCGRAAGPMSLGLCGPHATLGWPSSAIGNAA